MKAKCISFLIIGIIALSVIGFLSPEKEHKEYLRIHIRANSNLQVDQDVKYLIKDRVVEFLAPLIAECTTFEKAEKMLNDSLEKIDKVVNSVLKSKGFTYTGKSRLAIENFPTRYYGDLMLEAGFYKAIIIDLGSAKGDNWWCVVYPPLCFTESKIPVKYRSKILEIIDNFIKGER